MNILRTKTERLTVTGMLIAVGIILPFATSHGFGLPGNVLLPMHIPVFLCGLLCGPFFGGAAGIILPLLNCILTGMPAPYPNMPMMVCELFVYGLVSGLLFCKTPLGKKTAGVYISLVSAMICGRAVYGLVFHALLMFDGDLKAASVWTALVTGLPGIIIQLLLVPGVVFAVQRALGRSHRNAVASAKNLIEKEKATCVIIKDGKIVTIEEGRGISPVIRLYEEGLLENSCVVDKIIGKAAAMVLVLGGIKYCYGLTMSRDAVEFLEKNGVAVKYDKCTDYIISRMGDGPCPMEQTVKDISDPKEALPALKAKIEELKAKSN